jgi:DtxR family Mn-dependent transcriptional regulator
MPPISASLENYLEAILTLVEEQGSARARDIARSVCVHKSTVTAALRSLSKKGLVHYSPYEVATLTPTGLEAASAITQKHRRIRRFLTDVLLLGERVAEDNACRMEHVMDAAVMERLGLFARLLTGGKSAAAALRDFERRARRLEPRRRRVEGGARRRKT